MGLKFWMDVNVLLMSPFVLVGHGCVGERLGSFNIWMNFYYWAIDDGFVGTRGGTQLLLQRERSVFRKVTCIWRYLVGLDSSPELNDYSESPRFLNGQLRPHPRSRVHAI